MVEISPCEFSSFIGSDIRVDPVCLKDETDIDEILAYYMGKNTPLRQEFIIGNLRFEKNDILELAGN